MIIDLNLQFMNLKYYELEGHRFDKFYEILD